MITPFFTPTPGSHGLRSVESLIGSQSAAADEQAGSLLLNLVAIALGVVAGLALAKPWRRLTPAAGTGHGH